MAARRPQKIRSVTRAQTTNLKDPVVSRAVDQVRDIAQVALDRKPFDTVTQDLAVGTNIVRHGLGRAPAHVLVTPTTADATFGYALDTNNPHPDRQALITVVGVPQKGARIQLS